MKSKNKNINLSINCNGKLVDLNTPKVMGVLNITPDSFYDGGRYKDAKSILNQTEKLISEGATFLDIGAYSSRPGADFISENEELKRIVPVVELIQKNNPDVLISIDSFRAKVIRECVSAGAVISNDISAGKLDPDMIKTVGELGVPYIMMHMRGTPQTMKNHTTYQHLINEIYAYFSKQIELARQHNITDIIIDPGFGFAKTLAQNYELLNQMEFFKNLNCPILTGVSRKSMIYKVLGCTAEEALNGTTALNMVALMNGACILRVHDVKEAVECIKLFNQL
ncbi:dihydropteroate synthase [Formosa sp. Hel3_A1_48]|jgi:dihydropteroate synthase|uniref:dihydropteroate synthase n=1 Tax=Formosa sp. Hel3_A1_48 TaxID=1336795 RepID=UPI00084E1B9D|nr:dihydropteroate synthase [Formosa sp. Hel3_A1_48]AOR25701.1 dihydropteroate synthase [Formosa sp. Hel3_A1_48]MDG2484680.1 dihydropteroate synthase [Flavobacteriaceae bacterium]NCF42254.1 dihydropteroate synthase [Bacteroidota bacterium]